MNRRRALFGSDTPDEDAETPTFHPDPDEMRAELRRILAEMKGATAMPWDEKRVALNRMIFPQMTNALPQDEGAQLRFQFDAFVPFLLLVALCLWRSGVWERRVIREELQPEVPRYVTPGECRAILHDRVLRTRRIDALHKTLSAALVNAQHELAFRKRRVSARGGDPDKDALVAAWRGDIDRLRAIGAAAQSVA